MAPPSAAPFTAIPLSLAFLAQATAPATGGSPGLTAGASTTILVAVGVLIVLLVVAGLIILRVRAKLLARDDASDVSKSMLGELRAMRTQGVISEEEFNSIKRRLVERVSADKPRSK